MTSRPHILDEMDSGGARHCDETVTVALSPCPCSVPPWEPSVPACCSALGQCVGVEVFCPRTKLMSHWPHTAPPRPPSIASLSVLHRTELSSARIAILKPAVAAAWREGSAVFWGLGKISRLLSCLEGQCGCNPVHCAVATIDVFVIWRLPMILSLPSVN